MDKEYYFGGGIPPPLHFEPTTPTWNSISSVQTLDQSSDSCFFNPKWDNKSSDQFSHFDSALSSMVSSPSASVSAALPLESFALNELIGKLGNVGSSPPPPPFSATVASPYCNNNANTSCYSTPLNSPPKLQMSPILNQLVKDCLPNLGHSLPLNPSLTALSADPGFVARATKFSCFSSRSFNGRTSPFALNNNEMPYGSVSPLMATTKMPRVSSSPVLKQAESPVENKNYVQAHLDIRNSATRK